MSHRIVNRIVIEGDTVYIMDAPDTARPLRFLRREEPGYTRAFRDRGLRGLMEAVAADIHTGAVRLRAGSMVTRALRRGLHALGLERFQAMERQQAVSVLASMAERVMLNWDYVPTPEEAELPRQGEAEPLRVTLFGALELENSRGRVTENTARQSAPLRLLKYLLLQPDREADAGEVRRLVWPTAGEEKSDVGAARVRLKRLRESLEPLGLDGLRGLVLYRAERYFLNPDCPLILDTEEFTLALQALKTASGAQALALCEKALALYRGDLLEQTEDAPWADTWRQTYRRAFLALAEETLARMGEAEDYALLDLLCRRAARCAPGEEGLHRAIIRLLMELGDEVALTAHVARLARSGGAEWLES